MDRFFLSSEQWAAEVLCLKGEEGHHAVRVMRKKVGDRVELFDGEGHWVRGTVREVQRASLKVEPEEEGESHVLVPEVELAVAIPKGKTMDLIIQKAVELGVSRIQPLVTKNTVVKVSAEEAQEKSLKWQRVALEACKQCGQNFLPQVKVVSPIGHYLVQGEGVAERTRVIASLAPGAVPVRQQLEALSDDCEKLSFLVGPEGDFTAQEVTAALAAGFQPVSLGSIVLRVETACLSLAAAARYRFG